MDFGWGVRMGLVLLAVSAVLFWFHFLIFNDLYHLALYGLGDLAFMPIEVLVVSLIVHEVFAQVEKRKRMQKLNMVISAFYSEVGDELLKMFVDADPVIEVQKSGLLIDAKWTKKQFQKAEKTVASKKFRVAAEKVDLKDLKEFLIERRPFLLRLLENPNLLEHESFTDLLMAVFHLTDELDHRSGFSKLPKTDLEHLEGDMNRAYKQVASHWISYMMHLKRDYPYLFSLALRTNPFDKDADAVVRA